MRNNCKVYRRSSLNFTQVSGAFPAAGSISQLKPKFSMNDSFDDDFDGSKGPLSFPQHRFHQHIPGFTGHIHKLRDTFGTTYANSTRVAQQCPPSTPEPETHWDLTKGRREMTVQGHLLPGTGFMGTAKPTEESQNFRTYVHGSAVDVNAYYKTLEASGYSQVLIKSGSPHKAKSSIKIGDNFYFAGPHMWDTTYQESFEEPAQTETQVDPQSQEEDSEAKSVDMEEATFRYRILEAVCNPKRLDVLEEQIREKIRRRMAGGSSEMTKSFKLFASNNGTIHYDAFYHVAQDLGIDISPREAKALFGRFDINKDGAIVFYEFIDALLAKTESGNRDTTLYEQRHATVHL